MIVSDLSVAHTVSIPKFQRILLLATAPENGGQCSGLEVYCALSDPC